MSSLTRAFTKRVRRPEVSSSRPYHGQVKFSSGSIKNKKISAPVELLSTTNMLAYDAPDIRAAGASFTASLQSSDRSDVPTSPSTPPSGVATPLTSPDTSSHETSPVEPESNHLSGYFPKRSATVTSYSRSSTSSASTDSAPAIPQRALSHTKRSHQQLARQRSLTKISAPSLKSGRRTPSIDSEETFQMASQSHPFGNELEQVSEVAEEFGSTQLDEEEILTQKGFRKFTAAEYAAEIEDLHRIIFGELFSPTPITSSL